MSAKEASLHINILIRRYPHLRKIEPECDNANAVHAWHRFKEDVLGRENFHKNHFTLEDEETREFFEDMFDVDL